MTRKEFHERYTLDQDAASSGSFGTVYRAYDNYRDEWKAIKVAPVKRIGDKEYTLESEYGIAKELPVHRNVAHYDTVYRYREVNGEFSYAIMQFYEEGNLKELLGRTQLSLVQKKEIALGIINGIQFLHRYDIIHRDIKPNNVLISRKGDTYVPKISDFGISKIIDELDVTNTGIGWTSYSSPELIKGMRLTAASDLWSTGVLLYELFLGEHPFRGKSDGSIGDHSMQSISKAIVQQPLSLNVESIPAPFAQIIKQFLQKEPQPRLDNISHLLVKVKEPEVAVAVAPPVTLVDDTILLDKKKKRERKPIILPFLQSVGRSVQGGVSSIGLFFSSIGTGMRVTSVAAVRGLQSAGSSVLSGITGIARGIGAAGSSGVKSVGKGFTVLSSSVYTHKRKIAAAILLALISFGGYTYQDPILAGTASVGSSIGNTWNDFTTWIASASQSSVETEEMIASSDIRDELPEDYEVTSTSLVEESEENVRSSTESNDDIKEQSKSTLPSSSQDENNTPENQGVLEQSESRYEGEVPSEELIDELNKGTGDNGAEENERVEEELSESGDEVIVENKIVPEPSTPEVSSIDPEVSSTKTKVVKKPAYFAAIVTDMVMIPAGEFTFGCDDFDKKCDDDEGSGVKKSMRGFEMMAKEVTQQLYQQVMGTNPSEFERCGQCPVENVTWYEVKNFIKKLNSIDPSYTYKLPTEEEWEYAATANSKHVYSGGDKKNLDHISINAYNSKRRTVEVGRRRANSFGLYDMTGNVYEWCENNYESSGQKSIRGGSYMDKEGNSRINNRRGADPGSRYPWLGFRVMRKAKS